MDWLRLYCEARTDRKLQSLSDAQHRTWFNLLCLAGERPDRGQIRGYAPALLALEVAGGDQELLAATLERLVELRIVAVDAAGDLSFVNWLKRQYNSPAEYPAANRERVRQARQAVRVEAPVPSTPPDAVPVRDGPELSGDVRSCPAYIIEYNSNTGVVADATAVAAPPAPPPTPTKRKSRPEPTHPKAAHDAMAWALVDAYGWRERMNERLWGGVHKTAALLLDSHLTPPDVPRLLEAITVQQPWLKSPTMTQLPGLVGLLPAAEDDGLVHGVERWKIAPNGPDEYRKYLAFRADEDAREKARCKAVWQRDRDRQAARAAAVGSG